MKGYLLDTNIVLFGLSDDPRLSTAARDAILIGPNFISLATYWEVVIKSMKGKLDVGDAHVWWKRALLDLNAVPLPILANHIEHLKGLPAIHQDPFDRIVMASATAESLIVITADAEMQLYASERLRILG